MSPRIAGNRPDTMFIQSQNVPWTAHPSRGDGCRRRVLSRDPVTGAESFVMQLAPGYRQPRAGFLDHDFEFLLVRGELEIDGVAFRERHYGVHPAGYPHRSVASRDGATLIVITTGGPDGSSAADAAPAFREDRLARRIDVAERPWTLGIDRALLGAPPGLAPPAAPSAPPAPRRGEPGTCTKLLWQDPDSKGWTFLKADLPRRPRGPQGFRTHTADAEYFVLEGDYIITGEGRITPGGYFFWRAGVVHGPSACEHLSLTLAKYYGPMKPVPSAEQAEVTLDPPHRPHVPDEFREFAQPFAIPGAWS